MKMACGSKVVSVHAIDSLHQSGAARGDHAGVGTILHNVIVFIWAIVSTVVY